MSNWDMHKNFFNENKRYLKQFELDVNDAFDQFEVFDANTWAAIYMYTLGDAKKTNNIYKQALMDGFWTIPHTNFGFEIKPNRRCEQ